MLRNPETYEYLEPARFGRRRSMLVGRHSGRAVLRYLLEQLHVKPEDNILDMLYERYIASRPDGSCDELDDLRYRLAEEFGVAAGAR
jgi:2-isopropylmalate synthase